MTDKLRQAAELALEAMQDIIYWYSERDENDEVLPPYNQTPEILEAIQSVETLRQALAEPDTGIDRGAWADVPDATKWVDELRGDEELEEPPNSTTDVVEPIGEIVEAHGLIAVSIPKMPPVGTKLYTAPPNREWVGLTDNEILDTKFAKRFIDDVYAIVGQRDLLAFARELEQKWIARNEIHKR